MSKFRIFLTITFLKICFTEIKEISCEKELRLLEAKSADEASTKKTDNQDYKILQTLYSDSFSLNYYYTTLYIGKNKVKQTFIVDTGTAMMSSPCVPCEYCGANRTYYFENIEKKVRNPLKCGSKLCQMIPATGCNVRKKEKDKKSCSFYNQKSNGDALRGYFLKNIVYFEETPNATYPKQEQIYRSYALPIGCTLGEYGMYKEMKTDGVMGLSNDKTSFISLLYNLKIIKKNIFSLCLGAERGYMSLGDIDTTYHRSKNINYLPLLNSTEYYSINIKGIIIGKNKSLPITQMPAYIDSGSVLTTLPRKTYKLFIIEFNKLCKDQKGKNKCGNFSRVEDLGYCSSYKDKETLFQKVNEYWPNITFVLDNNTIYVWNPMRYFYYYIEKNIIKACVGFKSHRYNHTILGSKFMLEYDFIFDREQQLVGIVPSDCSRNTPSPTPIIANKEILKNESEVQLNFGDKVKKEEVRFIEGENKELENIDFKLINFIILSFSLLTIVGVLVVLVVLLIFNKKKYSKYQNISEETKKLNINQNNNAIEEINDTKVNQDDFGNVKKMMKKKNK